MMTIWWGWKREEREDKDRSSTSLRTASVFYYTLHAGIRLYLPLLLPLLLSSIYCAYVWWQGDTAAIHFTNLSVHHRLIASRVLHRCQVLHSTRSTWLLQQQSSASIITGWWCSINPIIPVHMVVRPFIQPSIHCSYPFPSLCTATASLLPLPQSRNYNHYPFASTHMRNMQDVEWMVRHSNERWFSFP